MSCCAITFTGYASVSEKIGKGAFEEKIIAPVRPVPTALVTQMVKNDVRVFAGTVQAQHRVEMGFSLDGLLVELNAREGSFIKKGEILAKIDQRDFRHAYESAKASHQLAKTELDRSTTLFKRKVISQADFDNSKTAFDVSKAELQIREKALEDTILLAPFDGVVAKRYVENTEHIKKQTPILAFKDISEFDVIIQIPERLIARSGADNFKDIKVKFDADSSRLFDGNIREYSVLSNPVTRTYDVAVNVPSPDDLVILPGMTATVSVTTSASSLSSTDNMNISTIPIEAVFGANDGNSYVWVIPENTGSPKKVLVSIGALQNEHIEINNGLEPGQRVAVAGVHSLRENMQVRPARIGREGLEQ